MLTILSPTIGVCTFAWLTTYIVDLFCLFLNFGSLPDFCSLLLSYVVGRTKKCDLRGRLWVFFLLFRWLQVATYLVGNNSLSGFSHMQTLFAPPNWSIGLFGLLFFSCRRCRRAAYHSIKREEINLSHFSRTLMRATNHSIKERELICPTFFSLLNTHESCISFHKIEREIICRKVYILFFGSNIYT